MTTRYFSFWCEGCPTRITVETEVGAIAEHDGDPEYSFAESEGVGLVRVREPEPGDDGLEVATLCPACGSQLHDLDDLLARGVAPYHENAQSAELHAVWLREVRDDGGA